MMAHPDEGRLNDYVDGALAADDAAAVASHLAECAACAGEVAALRELLVGAAELPRAIEPRDLWPEIVGRLERPGVLGLVAARTRRPAGGSRPSPWPMRIALAAAAGLLMVASSTVTLLLVRGGGEAPTAATAPSVAGTADGLRLVSAVESGYTDAVAELERSLAAGGRELQPETVAVIEENLRIIDQAIANAGAALARDPANLDLAHTLRYAWGRKVRLLERAVNLQEI